MAAEHAPGHRLLQPVPGIVLDHPDLLEDHLALAVHLLRQQAQAPHPVGLDPERLPPRSALELEVVEGCVVGRERVVRAAQALSQTVDRARPVGRRALEHHVLQEVGQTGLVKLLVPAAGAVAESNDDRLGPVPRQEHHAQAVVQRLGPTLYAIEHPRIDRGHASAQS